MSNALVVVLGPTAVGKTSISIELAAGFNGEIVSADSRLFYRGMDIGTAKPSIIELSLIKHHLVNVSEPDDDWSLGKYQKAAYAVIDEIHSSGKLPFLVGGTGQYIKSVYQGWTIPEVKADPKIRTALEKWAEEIGEQGLFNRLVSIDPDAASFIDPRNLRRTIRALEVIFLSGSRFSSMRKRTGLSYPALIIGITRSREEIYERIDNRLDAMISDGFISEVEELLNQGFSPQINSFSSIGYRQIAEYLEGKISLEEAITIIKRLSRQLVRRQANWFKLNDTQIKWFIADKNILDSITTEIEKFIKCI